MLSAVYGTLLTPSMVSKWSEDEDGKCKLCEERMGNIQHILAGCKVALSQGMYRWRHDKVLKQISEQVVFHCDRRVNKAGDGRQFIDFVPAGRRKAERIAESHEYKLYRYSGLQAEIQAKGWCCYNAAVEVGARGVVAQSLERAARRIGFRGRELKKLVRDSRKEAAHCSRWIYLLSGRKEWEFRKVGA
ncbi:uncharacterized protein LOC134810939 [Bolinopsis microptera]|uniref:uncharacterized protein LOC134810939 n=1 Tax=Bolinopsis microptera TaxID=2820187 RepID=UPI003079A1E9